MKHYRALHEQASTYLDLVCSVCDLSDDAVRVTAAEVQQVKLTVSELKLELQQMYSTNTYCMSVSCVNI